MSQFGRKWELTIINSDGSVKYVIPDPGRPEEVDLRIQFEIQTAIMQTPWYSDITIWNLNALTEQQILTSADKVIMKAGYEDAAYYGKIFEGNVFQSLFDRENVTDFKTTLHCIDGLGIMDSNIVNFTTMAGYDQRTLIAQMSRQARTPINMGTITDSLKPQKMPRGKVLFGDHKKYLRDIAQDNGASHWYGNGNLNMGNINDTYQSEALVLTPDSGLIGTPQQIENGVYFRVLLNPNLKIIQPMMVVKLDMSVIRQMKVYQNQLIGPLDEDGEYKIVSVKHVGDTRGDEWYTDCIGINLVGNVSALFGVYPW